MNSSHWGPPLHKGLFLIAAGFDLNETPLPQKKKQYKDFFKSIGNVLPCKYCRVSYNDFFEQLDIDRYMDLPACGLIKFYYDMREKINRKLEAQEEKALAEEYQKLSSVMSPADPEFWKRMRAKSHQICYTKPAPPFEKVVEELYTHRAGCSAHMKTCRSPLVSDFPTVPNALIGDPNRTGKSDREYYSSGGGYRSKSKKVKSKTHKTNTRPKTKSKRKSLYY